MAAEAHSFYHHYERVCREHKMVFNYLYMHIHVFIKRT